MGLGKSVVEVRVWGREGMARVRPWWLVERRPREWDCKLRHGGVALRRAAPVKGRGEKSRWLAAL